MAFHIRSSAFAEGEEIPLKYSGEGENLSPPLEWTGVPHGTRELALVCEDPDSPSDTPFVHWVIYKIPPDWSHLPEGTPNAARLRSPPGALQGKNSYRSIGYKGPKPPVGHGWHRYRFRLFAVDRELGLGPGATREELSSALSGHLTGQTECMGRFKRDLAPPPARV